MDADYPEVEVDYPAAHSMFVEWFAVDRDGHLGRFNNAGAAAVPSGATFDYNEDEIPKEYHTHYSARVTALPVVSAVAQDISGWLLPGPFGPKNRHATKGKRLPRNILFFLRSL